MRIFRGINLIFREEIKMLSIIAFLSDIPWYIAEIISKITGADASAILDFISGGYAEIMDAINTIIK